MAKLRLDGWVSLDAGPEEGVLLTKPVVFLGKKLVLNAKSEGGMTIEVLTEDPQARRKFGKGSDVFRGDSLRHTVTWNGKSDVSSLQGSKIQLRIRPRNAKFFSFRFGS